MTAYRSLEQLDAGIQYHLEGPSLHPSRGVTDIRSSYVFLHVHGYNFGHTNGRVEGLARRSCPGMNVVVLGESFVSSLAGRTWIVAVSVSHSRLCPANCGIEMAVALVLYPVQAACFRQRPNPCRVEME